MNEDKNRTVTKTNLLKKIAALFIQQKNEHNTLKEYGNSLIVILLFLFFLTNMFSAVDYNFSWQSIFPYRELLLTGFYRTIIIAFFGGILSIIIGFVLAILQRNRFLPAQYSAKLLVEIIRSTPLIVQILVFYYIIATALQLSDLEFNIIIPGLVNWKIESRYLLGLLILALFEGTYVSEIIRAGIESIGKTQHETANSLGFSAIQKYRYIIFPQVIKRVIPSLVGQMTALIKDSSLLSVIGIIEYYKQITDTAAKSYLIFELYLVLAVGYIIVIFPISYVSKKLERRFSYET